MIRAFSLFIEKMKKCLPSQNSRVRTDSVLESAQGGRTGSHMLCRQVYWGLHRVSGDPCGADWDTRCQG